MLQRGTLPDGDLAHGLHRHSQKRMTSYALPGPYIILGPSGFQKSSPILPHPVDRLLQSEKRKVKC